MYAPTRDVENSDVHVTMLATILIQKLKSVNIASAM